MKFETLKKSHKKEMIIGALVICMLGILLFRATRAKYKITENSSVAAGTTNYKVPDLRIIVKTSEDGTNYDYNENIPNSGYSINKVKSACRIYDGSNDPESSPKDESITIEYKNNKVNILGASTKNTRCYLYFDKERGIRGNANAIINSGELTEENGWRYQGSDPDNYVLFNGDELWRIIGVFNVTTEAGDQENLIKIIRDDSIGDISWDSGGTSGENDWTTSDIKTILNGQYYNGEDINYSYRNPDNTEISNKTVTIAGKSLKEDAIEKVESVVWNLGGASSNDITTEEMYNAERGETVYSGRPTTWTGYIGLMYPSDYGYASPSSTCPRTTTLFGYDSTGCFDNNWLGSSDVQWTITPVSSTGSDVFGVVYGFAVDYGDAYTDIGGSPSLYLKSSVQIIGGKGTDDEPYILSD